MSDAMTQERIILKVLSGVQAGAEVSLPAGDYTIGSGPNDDLQFVDVSLKPAHARLRVSPSKMEVMALSGSLASANGLGLGAGTEAWQEIEPLDIVTIGTIRFALGPATANWTSLNDVADDRTPDTRQRVRRRPVERAKTAGGGGARLLQLVLPIALLAMVGAGIWYLVAISGHAGAQLVSERRSDVDVLREAFDKFPFGKSVVLKQEVDGTIYASGYVDSPVERRALMGTAEKLGEPVRFRVNVLQTMRSEVDNLIKSAKLPLTFTLASSGDLALDGLILNDASEKKFVDQLKSDVIGLGPIDDRIRTAPKLLAEIEKLARLAQIDSYIVVRLDNDLIEVNGVLPVDKIDAWVGFLQSYTRRFGKDIGLRSFVQLQNAAGVIVSQTDTIPGQAIAIGEKRPGSNDIVLDIERLKRGLFDLSDVFIGVDKRKQGATTLAVSADQSVPGLKYGVATSVDPSVPAGQLPAKDAVPPPPAPTAQLTPPALPPSSISIEESSTSRQPVPGTASDPNVLAGAATSSQVAATATSAAPGVSPAPASATPAGPGPSAGPGPLSGRADRHIEEISNLIRRANDLINGWLSGKPDGATTEALYKNLHEALDRLAVTRAALDQDRAAPKKIDRATLAVRYLPLFTDEVSQEPSPADMCWPGSRLTARNLPVALFWLDLLSISSSLSVDELDRDEQGFILEAALNPTASQQCLQRAQSSPKTTEKSLYLAEAGRNPEFIRFITRNLKPAQLEVSGANLSGVRFIQTRDGYKMREGVAPDGLSRIAMVGELGVALRLDVGYSTVIYGRDLNWMLSQN